MEKEEFVKLFAEDGLSPEFAERQWSDPEVQKLVQKDENPVELVKVTNQLFIALFGTA